MTSEIILFQVLSKIQIQKNRNTKTQTQKETRWRNKHPNNHNYLKNKDNGGKKTTKKGKRT